MFVQDDSVQGILVRFRARLCGTSGVALCLLALPVPALAQDLTWALPGDGSWDQTSLNWVLPGGAPSAFTDGASVIFGGAITAPGTVSIDGGTVAATGLTFAASDYIIESGAFALTPSNGALALGLEPGVAATITAPLTSLATDVITITGDASSNLDLAGNNAASLGLLDISGGGVVLNGDYGGSVAASGVDANLGINAAVGGDLTVTSGIVTHNEAGEIAGATTVAGDGKLIANGGTFAGAAPGDNGLINLSGGTVEIAADTSADIVNTGGLATVNTDQVLFGIVDNTAGTFENFGTVTGLVTNAGTVTASGTFASGITNDGGTVTVSGDSAADIVNLGGTVTIAPDQTLTGNVTTGQATGLVSNSGTLIGDVTITDGTVDNDGLVIGNTVINGGTLDNSGTLDGTVFLDQTGGAAANLTDTGGIITGVVTNTDGTITAQDTTFQSGITQNGGSLSVSGADLGTGISNAGGTVSIAGTPGSVSTGGVTNTGGSLTIDADQTLTGEVANSAALSTTTVNGTLIGDLDVSAGSATNAGLIDGDVTLSDGGQLIASGEVTGNVTLDGTSGGDPTLVGQGATIGGAVTNDAGTIIATGTTFTGGILQNSGTTTLSGGDLGTGLTNAGGLVTLDGATAATVTGDIANVGGDLEIVAGQTLDGSVTNSDAASDITHAGVILGDVTLTDGTLTHSGLIGGDLTATDVIVTTTGGTVTGTTLQSGGQILSDGGNFEGGVVLSDGGDFVVAGDSTGDVQNIGGTIDLQSGQSLSGNVVQTDGSFVNGGAVDGTVQISGGELSNAVGADIAGLTTLQDGGTLNADGGSYSGGLRLEGGTLNATGDIIGSVVNAGSDLEFVAPQEIFGDLINESGTLEFDGTVQGDLIVENGVVTTAGTTLIENATEVSGGTLQIDGGTFDGGILVDGGALDVAMDTAAGGLTVADGNITLQPDATLTSDFVATGGISDLAGTVTGDLTQSAGLVTQSGNVAGTANVSGGTLLLQDGTFSGGASITGGDLILQSGIVDGIVTNDGGAVSIMGLTTADVVNAAGTLSAGGVLDGSVTNADILIADNGRITGDLVQSGTLDVTDGDLTVNQLTTTSTGSVTVSDGNILAFEDATLEAGSTLTVDNGILDGDLTAEAGANLAVQDLTVTGDFASMTSFSNNGTLSVGGDMMLAAPLTFETGEAGIDGTLTVAEGVTLNMQSDTGVAAGALVNDGSVLAANNVAFDGTFINNATITSSGTLSFGAGLQNSGVVDLVNGATGDNITIAGGNLSGGGTLQFDLDLSDSEGASDSISMASGAFITGDVTLSFNVLGSGGQQANDILLIDVAAGDPGNFDVIADEIVDPSGVLNYSVTRNGAGDVVLVDGLNPGIAGLAGNIVLTQSLIGSVVNRPSSPFVTSLAFDDVNPCGSGMWGRAIAGGATSIGAVSQEGEQPFDGEISATYAGLQFGGDYACFNGAFQGWDVAVGAIGGINTGTTSQPVFAIDVNSEGNLSDLQTGTTSVDFDQFYAGTYVTAVKGPLAFDLQYRFESTDFTATNIGAGGLPGLGLDNTEFSSFGTTLSGAASYVYSIPETDLALVQTAGFAYTQVSTDPITFDSRGTVQIADFESKIGFIGGALARSSFGDDGASAFREFLSATIYNDFADGPRSTFSPIDDSGDRGVETENLGLYSEVSFGLNYVRVLQENEFGAVKQFSANARIDARVSKRLDSWGITAQARFQF